MVVVGSGSTLDNLTVVGSGSTLDNSTVPASEILRTSRVEVLGPRSALEFQSSRLHSQTHLQSIITVNGQVRLVNFGFSGHDHFKC